MYVPHEVTNLTLTADIGEREYADTITSNYISEANV